MRGAELSNEIYYLKAKKLVLSEFDNSEISYGVQITACVYMIGL